jgi:hypothetical protein
LPLQATLTFPSLFPFFPYQASQDASGKFAKSAGASIRRAQVGAIMILLAVVRERFVWGIDRGGEECVASLPPFLLPLPNIFSLFLCLFFAHMQVQLRMSLLFILLYLPLLPITHLLTHSLFLPSFLLFP